MKKELLILGLSISCLSGCTTIDPYSREERTSKSGIGMGMGAISGAVIGGLAGGDAGSTLIGAGIGSVAGGIVGNIMDHQDAELRRDLQNTGVQVKRIGQDIRLVMNGDITFENNRVEIRSDFYRTLNAIVKILEKYKGTVIKIAGYTSNVGDPMYNQVLSEKRAKSVADYLISHGVKQNRISTLGYGARNPIADNSTKVGQARNRRVEITLHQI